MTLHPMSSEVGSHILIAYKLAAARLLASHSDSCPRLVIKLHQLVILRRDCYQKCRHLVLISRGQLPKFLDRLFKHFGHINDYGR